MAWGDHAFATAVAAVTFLAAVAGGVGAAGAASATRTALASIDVTKSDTGLVVKGRVLALVPGHFEATMAIIKSGTSGSMKTNQGGKLDLAAGETGVVAQAGLSFAPGDTLEVSLEVTSGGAVVSSSHLVVP